MIPLVLRQIDGLLQERHNSGALAMELHPSYTNPSKYECLGTEHTIFHNQQSDLFCNRTNFMFQSERPSWYSLKKKDSVGLQKLILQQQN